mgnify:CR=1 FL=1
MKIIEVTEEEWNRIADEFADKNVGASSFMVAMARITDHMNQYKIVKKKKIKS